MLPLLVTLLLSPSADVEPKAKLDAKTQAKIKALRVERRDVLKKIVRVNQINLDRDVPYNGSYLQPLLNAAKDLLKSELALATNAAERIAAHAAHLKLMQETEAVCKARKENLGGYLLPVKVALLEAEIDWLEAGGKEAKKDK